MKEEKKQAPLLYNLAELQNECSKMFKISPDETLNVVQELYENKLVTYPRTDARVLSTAVAKEIHKNIGGLQNYSPCGHFAVNILKAASYKGIEKTKYVDDRKITDHYAIIPTGQGYENYEKLPELQKQIYKLIVKRFLAIFYPPAEYSKVQVTVDVEGETFYASGKVCVNKGY